MSFSFMGPAEQPGGASFYKSDSSLLIRLKAAILNIKIYSITNYISTALNY